MNIGIDARVLEKNMTGIGRYLSDILNGVPIFDRINNYTLFSTKEITITNSIFKRISTGAFKVPDKIFSPYWLNFILPSIIEKNNVDIFFSPNNLLPAKKLKCKSVVVIHDVNHLVNKKHVPFFYRNYLYFQLPYTIKNSDIIITISEKSRDEIIKFFKIDKEKIKIIHRAADPKFVPLDITYEERTKIKNRLKLPEKFILFVGVIETRKNIEGILRIADIVHSKRPDIKFLLIGKPGHEFNKINKELNKRINVIYKNYIEDVEIKYIYNLAFAFLFPSYYEGFGLPPLEAMQCGIPVLTSDIEVLKEVVGNGGFIHEPDDHESFAKCILELDSNPILYSEIKTRALEQAKKFSYSSSILKLLTVFDELKTKNF